VPDRVSKNSVLYSLHFTTDSFTNKANNLTKEDLSDMVYTVKLVFNQKLLCSYDSRLEKYVGSDELGIRNAEHYNNQMPPVVTVRSNSKARYGQLTTLECHAYNFYPQAINVTWLLDGSEVTGDVVSTEFMDNGDWSYQMHSYLELVLHRGVPVSCRVEHSGLKEPLVTLWGETRLDGQHYKRRLAIVSFSGVDGKVRIVVFLTRLTRVSAFYRTFFSPFKSHITSERHLFSIKITEIIKKLKIKYRVWLG
uniref:Ig-like domain-containing protein n=1 Tax=Sinocyclocheilus anshuiensis TaxID=1608454 RepID=A0A671QM72_9TELE